MKKIRIILEESQCAGCLYQVAKSLKDVDGILISQVNNIRNTIIVYTEERIQEIDIKKHIHMWGYKTNYVGP